MALFTPSQSPAVVVKEIDATGGVPNVQTSTGAIVGNFRSGPIGQRVLISNEEDLVNTFGTPDTTNTIDFHNASSFLRYSNSLYVVRQATSAAKNAHATQYSTAGRGPGATGYATPSIDNKTIFDGNTSMDSDGQTFVARSRGTLGNSLKVSICPPDAGPSDDSSAWYDWAYASYFDAKPGSSVLDSARGGTNTEAHLVVVDEWGEISGTRGTVLETFPFVSVANNSKNADGTSNYIKDLVNERSEYIYMVNFDSDHRGAKAGNALSFTVDDSNITFQAGLSAARNFTFDSGVASGTLATSDIATGHDLFEDVEAVEVDFLIAPGMSSDSDQVTVTNDLIANAVARKDCIVVTSPSRTAVVGVTNETTATTNIVATSANITKSDRCVMDGNYLKIYDKFNDQYIHVPAAPSTAGLMAETDRVAAPWFSPAGTKRGQYLGVTSIDYNPNKTNRDTLYKAGINPVVNMAGSGVVLYGDKTMFNRPSAFDRINVRRLFLTLERAIAQAAKNVMFEFNDEFTRAEFVNIIEPVLRDVKARRGITDFRVIADETVNTPEVIDRNEFIANIFIKPARSINFVTLNFVAVRTGVSFEEVVGTAGV